MGDMSEYKGLITVVSFLGVFVLLLGLFPYDLLVASDSNRAVDVPSELIEVMSIYSFAETKTVYLNNSGTPWWLDPTNWLYWDIDIGSWDIDLYYTKPNQTVYTKTMNLVHVWYDWWIFPADDHLEFFSSSGESLGEGLTVLEIGTENPQTFRATCSHTTYTVGMGYNDTTYSNYSDAWDHGGVAVFCGVNFDQVNTSYNAMNLISTLLFFSMPAETPLIIKLIISIPIWACVAYLMFIFVLRTIGAIFGGGA